MAPKLKPPPKPPIPVPVSIHSVFANPDDIQYLSDEDALSPAHFGGGEAAVPSKHRPRSSAEPTEDAFGPPPTKDDALGPHLPEDASGPPQTDYADDDAAANDVAYVQQLIVAEDAAYVLELLERESAAELAALTPAVQPQVPSAPPAIAPAPAQDAMSEMLFLMRQQQADMDALKQELAAQRERAKQNEVKHAAEAHLRAIAAQDVANRGRVMPIGPFVPAPLVKSPAPKPNVVSATLPKSQVSRSSQADEQPAPKAARPDPGAKKAAAEGADVRHAPPTLRLPEPKKKRAATPPVPDDVNSDEDVIVITKQKASAQRGSDPEPTPPKAKQTLPPLPMLPPCPVHQPALASAPDPPSNSSMT